MRIGGTQQITNMMANIGKAAVSPKTFLKKLEAKKGEVKEAKTRENKIKQLENKVVYLKAQLAHAKKQESKTGEVLRKAVEYEYEGKEAHVKQATEDLGIYRDTINNHPAKIKAAEEELKQAKGGSEKISKMNVLAQAVLQTLKDSK